MTYVGRNRKDVFGYTNFRIVCMYLKRCVSQVGTIMLQQTLNWPVWNSVSLPCPCVDSYTWYWLRLARISQETSEYVIWPISHNCCSRKRKIQQRKGYRLVCVLQQSAYRQCKWFVLQVLVCTLLLCCCAIAQILE